jgi:hypothetical protein
MIRAFILTTILGTGSLGTALADTPLEPGANAALKYWQAFATLPKLSDADSQRLSARRTEEPLNDQDRQVTSAAEYALTMLQRGAALPRCDWGIGYDDGIFLRTPQFGGSYTLSSLACLRAHIRFEQGHNAEALDDLLATMILGRHLSAAGVSPDLLAGYAVEHRSIDALARDLPRLKPSEAAALKGRLETLPAGGRPALAMRGDEQLLLDWLIRSVKEAKNREALLALLTLVDQVCSLPDKPKDPEARGRAFLEACGGNAQGVVDRAEAIRPLYAVLTTRLDLPLDQFAEQWRAVETKHAGNPIRQAFFGRILHIRFQQARVEVRRAYLVAALDVRVNGRNALARHKDPVVGKPIEYLPFPGGFELRSKLKWESGAEPVALTVGSRRIRLGSR